MVTAVAKLVDLQATPFSGDLMEAVTHFERRVTSWEDEEVWRMEEFVPAVLINIAGTTE